MKKVIVKRKPKVKIIVKKKKTPAERRNTPFRKKRRNYA